MVIGIAVVGAVFVAVATNPNKAIVIQRRDRHSLKSVVYDLPLGLGSQLFCLVPPLIYKEVRYYECCVPMNFILQQRG
jgi:hypothetical protein